jgi:hypothetical protein
MGVQHSVERLAGEIDVPGEQLLHAALSTRNAT